jgi:hypothetical protein
MDAAEAKRKLLPLVPAFAIDAEECEVVGLALAVLLSEGYHDLTFDCKGDGSVTLETGGLELIDERDGTPRGELQRHIQLMVRAALLTQPQKGAGDGTQG